MGAQHMSQEFFETSFGHSIKITDQYRLNLPPSSKKRDLVTASSIQASTGIKAPRESDYGIVSDIYQFAMFEDWINRTAVGDRRFDRMLDIGGSTGLIGQLFKAIKRVREVENIEILDYQDSSLSARVEHILRRIHAGRQQIDLQPRIRISRHEKWVLAQLSLMQDFYPYPIDRHSSFWKVGPDAPPSVDRFIIGDFFELEEKYDFLLSATAMHHCSVVPFLRKAHSLLAPGGVLLIWNCYWYWAMIISGAFGHFPWAVQRLTWEDFTRYMNRYQPENLDGVQAAVNQFHKGEKRYTINDYIAVGQQAGLKYLDHYRLVPFSGIHNQIGPWRLEGDHGISAQKEVLRDIHCFRQDVDLIDLSTHSIFLLLQKE